MPTFRWEKWVEAVFCRAADHRVVLKFLKENIFSRFRVPKSIISDGGSHLCNKPFENLLAKYGVKHKVATPYHPQTSGQVELANREIKTILMKVVSSNRKDWSFKLLDSLWAYRTAYKTILAMFTTMRNFARLRNHTCVPLHFPTSSSPTIFHFLHLFHNYSRFLSPSFNTPFWTLIGLTLSPSLTPLFKHPPPPPPPPPPIFLPFFISNHFFSLEHKHSFSISLHLLPFSSPGMVKTRGGHIHRPRVQTSSPIPADGSNPGPHPTAPTAAPLATTAPAASQVTPVVAAAVAVAASYAPVPAAPAPRKYDTRVGPTPPSPPHPRLTRRALPSKRARASSPRESSSSRP